jgi:ornithine cyclodeaminase
MDGDTGVPLVMIDGPELTARRTAAVSALAARYLAPADCRTHLVIGAGKVAACAARSHRQVRPIERTLVWARAADKAKALCAELRGEGLAAEAVGDLAAAIAGADLITTATLAADPVLPGAALKREVHLDLIGAYLPHMREADDAAIAGAAIWVDNPVGALSEAGELAIPLASGTIAPEAIRGGLADLVRCQEASWTRPPGKTAFKSVGMAVSDFAAAQCVLKRLAE